MHHKEKSSHLVALLGLSVALFLVGCGGGGGGSADSPTVTAATVPADAASAADADSGPPAPDFIVANKQITEAPAGLADGATSATVPVADVSLPSTPLPVLAAVTADPAQMATALAVRTATPEATAAVTSPSLDIFVATNGNDAWSGLVATANAGLTDGPVRTLATAQLRARTQLAAMTAGATRQTVRVVIAPGQYVLASPLAFTPADSGQPGFPMVYVAQTTGTVQISGGQSLGYVAPTAAGQIVSVAAPNIDSLNLRGGTQLYAEGRRATLARTPNAGSYWFVQRSVALPSEPAGQLGQEAFAPGADALAMINSLSAADRSRAIVNVMQSWTSAQHRLSDLAVPVDAIRVTPRGKWPFLSFGTDQRFYVENLPSALDALGEWIWEGNSVRYISTVTDAGRSFWLVMPVLDRLITVKGTESSNTYVQDLEFRGLSFAYTRYLTPDAGYVDNQTGSTVGAAIEVDAARRVVIDSCNISRTGGYGIWFRNAVRDSTISNCNMSDLGAGGVKVGLTTQAPTYLAGTGANRVHANIVQDTGKLVPGAVGVFVGQSFDNTVSNNLIANTTYSGISVGWKWAYGTPTAGRNAITNNLLLNIGQGMLSDIGAIYTAGESPGTVISGNVIHEVRPYPTYGVGAWGLYNDAASSNILVERNIVVGTEGGGYYLNSGRSNIVRSNLLAFGERSEVRVGTTDPTSTNLAFSDNLLMLKNGSPLASFASAPDVTFTANQVSDRVLSKASDLTKCGSGCARVNTTLSGGSDPRVIALTGADATTAAWVAAVGAAVGPPNLPASAIPKVLATLPAVFVAPPTGYVLDLAGTALDGQPLNMRYGGKSATYIHVAASTGTPTGKCLRFDDSATIVNRWEPFGWVTLNHGSGTSSVEFSIKIDANTKFLHEWRDNANVYLVGPSLYIKPTGVEVAGKVVALAPVGQWLTFTVTAGLGTAAGTWRLDVKNAAGAITTVNNLPVKSSSWKQLNWLGMVSDASVASSACLGYVIADNK